MNISFDYVGCYFEHKLYFDAMAKAMQAAGHRVGILTGEREERRGEILKNLGFPPDFILLWGETETISNGASWKCQKMLDEDIAVHYDDDATDMKRFTGRWVIKVMNSDAQAKF